MNVRMITLIDLNTLVKKSIHRSSKISILVTLETALEIPLTQKLKIRPLIIEVPNFKENSKLPTPTVY